MPPKAGSYAPRLGKFGALYTRPGKCERGGPAKRRREKRRRKKAEKKKKKKKRSTPVPSDSDIVVARGFLFLKVAGLITIYISIRLKVEV